MSSTCRAARVRVREWERYSQSCVVHVDITYATKHRINESGRKYDGNSYLKLSRVSMCNTNVGRVEGGRRVNENDRTEPHRACDEKLMENTRATSTSNHSIHILCEIHRCFTNISCTHRKFRNRKNRIGWRCEGNYDIGDGNAYGEWMTSNRLQFDEIVRDGPNCQPIFRTEIKYVWNLLELWFVIVWWCVSHINDVRCGATQSSRMDGDRRTHSTDCDSHRTQPNIIRSRQMRIWDVPGTCTYNA